MIRVVVSTLALFVVAWSAVAPPARADSPAPPAASSPAPDPAASEAPDTIVVPLPLPAEPLPTAEVLKAAVREASGHALTQATVVEDEVDGDVHESSTTYIDGDRYREVRTAGPLVTQRGFDGHDHWHENANGEVVVEAPSPGLDRPDRPTYAVERAVAPLDAFVLVRTIARTTRRTTIDRVTGRVLRIESKSPSGTSVETFDDFRTTGTSTRAWHTVIRDGHPDDDAAVTVRSIVLGHVAENDLALPAGRRLVVFPFGVTKVALPVELHRGKFIVRLVIDGRGLDFTLDSGAAGIVIDDDVARQLGLTSVGHRGNAANAGRIVQSTLVVPEVHIGALTMHDVAMGTIPSVETGVQDAYKSVGLLGFDFIADTKLVLDYAAGTVTAYDPDIDVPMPTGPHSFVLPVRLGDEAPETSVTINGSVGEHFLVDSGAEGGLFVFDRFARRHAEALVDDSGKNDITKFVGVGGEIATRPYRLHSVKFGGVDLQDFVAYRLMSARQYAGGDDGLLGSGFLDLFTVTIDYRDAEIGFALNSLGANGL